MAVRIFLFLCLTKFAFASTGFEVQPKCLFCAKPVDPYRYTSMLLGSGEVLHKACSSKADGKIEDEGSEEIPTAHKFVVRLPGEVEEIGKRMVSIIERLRKAERKGFKIFSSIPFVKELFDYPDPCYKIKFALDFFRHEASSLIGFEIDSGSMKSKVLAQFYDDKRSEQYKYFQKLAREHKILETLSQFFEKAAGKFYAGLNLFELMNTLFYVILFNPENIKEAQRLGIIDHVRHNKRFRGNSEALVEFLLDHIESQGS